MVLIEKINKYKNKIFKFIEKEINIFNSDFLDYSFEKNELFENYKNFILRGKGIRGSLVFLTNNLFKGKKINRKNFYYLASFFELIHSTLLIHDDIMDDDTLRRGEKTINFYYQEKYQKISQESKNLGNNLAINIGDIGFFISFYFLSKLNIDKKTKNYLIYFLTKEYIKVALAQTDDVVYSSTNYEPKEEEIKKIYLYKTSRYTFVLPIISTLILIKNKNYKNKNLIKILENLGLIFQITDDLIGFLSDETGKTIGSDIKENKKTIIYFYLKKEIKNDFKKIFGKKNVKSEEINRIRFFYLNSKTKRIIEEKIDQLKIEVEKILLKEKFPKKFNQFILEIIKYLIERKK
ncbi:MAG: polyprenyl synthetase family protein [Patescibacteria group bacterium]|nr:polyprenyl synthetase family protein [Patescibacteria group bacterium]